MVDDDEIFLLVSKQDAPSNEWRGLTITFTSHIIVQIGFLRAFARNVPACPAAILRASVVQRCTEADDVAPPVFDRVVYMQAFLKTRQEEAAD